MFADPPPKPIRVCLVEDDADLRAQLSLLLRQVEGILFCRAYASAEQALASLPGDRPDVVLMDINLPVQNGIECVRQLKAAHPKINFLMHTVYEDSERIFNSLKAGASGYILKRAPRPEILSAIADAHAGGAPMSSAIARKVVQYFQQPAPSADLATLTDREREVLTHLAQGLINKEIATQLGTSVETVRKQLHSIYEKLHVRCRTEAVVKYIGR